MKSDNEMDRLRAARPAVPPPADDHAARFAQTVAEPGDPRLADPATIGNAHSARRWTVRPRIAAGGSLGLAAVVTGLVLALSGSTAPPAFAITHNADGSLLLHLYHVDAVPAIERQVNAIMGTEQRLVVGINRGPATVPGPITCSTADQGPRVEMLLGSDGTDIVPAGVRGAGPWHLVECSMSPDPQLDQIGRGNGGSSTSSTGSTGSNTTNTGDTSTN
jgi:hypothetical protein